MFISRESLDYNIPPKFALTAHVFGAEAGHPFIQKCMKYYERRHFDYFEDNEIPETQQYTCVISPSLMRDIAIHLYDYNPYAFLDKIQVLKEDINIYPAYYFDGQFFLIDKDKAFSGHHCNGGWISGKNGHTINFGSKRVPLRWKLAKIFRTITIKLFGRVLIIKFFKVHPSERL